MLLLYLKKNNQKCSGIIDNNVNYIDTDIKKKFSVSNIKILKNQKDFMILICNQDDQNAIQIKKQLIKNRIQLHIALGGDFSAPVHSK